MMEDFNGDHQPVDACSPPVEPSHEALEERVRRTHDNLVAWRKTAVRRREAWEQAQAAAHAEAQQRRQLWTSRAGIAAAAAFLIGLSAALVAPRGHIDEEGSSERRLPKTSHIVASLPMPVAAAATPRFDPVLLEPTLLEPVPVATAGTADLVEPASHVVSVDPDSVRTWQDRAHQWVYFEVQASEAAWMTWRDASGKAVLTDMRCYRPEAGVRRCVAGRGLQRIQAELASGAAEGTWTVEACVPQGCSRAATFDVTWPKAVVSR